MGDGQTEGWNKMTVMQQKLMKLKNYATRYEIVARRGNDSLLVGYTGRRSRRGLIGMICQQREYVVAKMGEEFCIEGDAARVGGWSISFSGRTQRDAIVEGELAFIGD